MVSSKAPTVAQYLEHLPPDRRAVMAAVRAVVRRHLPKGYKELMSWGMISYELPLAQYPNTYNKRPLCFAGLAAQKNHYALYLTSAYQDGAQRKKLEAAFKRAGKKLDMGKSCLRFRTLDDLDLDAVADVVASTPPKKLIAMYEKARAK